MNCCLNWWLNSKFHWHQPSNPRLSVKYPTDFVPLMKAPSFLPASKTFTQKTDFAFRRISWVSFLKSRKHLSKVSLGVTSIRYRIRFYHCTPPTRSREIKSTSLFSGMMLTFCMFGDHSYPSI
jgi:hypothetical protein